VSQVTRVKTASSVEPRKQSLQTRPMNEQIRQSAYEIYASRNGASGDEVQDWLLAERELSSKQP
jgi:hypothetical protein